MVQRFVAARAAAFACFASLSLAAGAASAEELRPMQGGSIAMSGVNGIVYYTECAEGYRVIATLAGEEGAPIRMVATLQPGQSVTLSVPHAPGVPADEVQLLRSGDRLLVSSVGPAVPMN